MTGDGTPDSEQDPVQRGLGGREDLYDIAEWEPRTALDQFAVKLAWFLRAAGTWLLIGIAALLFLAQAAVIFLFIAEEPVLGVLAALSVVPALALAAYFWFEDPTRREPLSTMAATFLLSMLFASFAAVTNTLLNPVFGVVPAVGSALFFFLVVGPVEETVKWASIRVHAYRTDEFDAVVDGVVYGAIAGLGFAAIENLIYIVNIYSQVAPAGAAAQLQSATDTAYVRAFVGPGHVVYSSFAGYYLGLAKFNPDNRGPIVLKGLVIAAFIHALYNTLVTYLPLSDVTFALFLVGYVGFWGGLLYRKMSRYKTHYRKAQDAVDGERSGDGQSEASGDGEQSADGW